MGDEGRGSGYKPWPEDYGPVRTDSGDYDNEDVGYEQWEEGYTEGDDGTIQEAYFLDPDADFTEEDLLFAENAFSPHMTGSPVPKDGLEEPDLPGSEMATDDATTDPYEAIEQGKIYYPPEDPPIVPSRRLRDADIANGFAPSADETSLEERNEPERFEVSDLQIAANAREALRLHGYTSDMDNIRIQVQDGVATLHGKVRSLQDIFMVEDIVSEVEGIEEVREHLTVE